jgi:CRISPR-associated protein Cmr2
MNDTNFWKQKLMAYLHDPPDKCLDIGGHELSATSFQKGAGFTDDDERKGIAEAVKPADHFASSAERFVFPRGKCATTFTGRDGEAFVHPLSGVSIEAGEDVREFKGLIHDVLQQAVGGICTSDWRKRHFLYWRCWQENAVDADKKHASDNAFFPADTRIPDHTIWNHMTVTSAFAGCIEGGEVKPSLVLFQFGPVQDFIAQARSTRDLWSGSYLISWLMAHAMKAVSDKIGPDAIIFPNLRGNGIFDALHQQEMYATLYDDGKGGKDTLWKRMIEEKGDDFAPWLLRPTLPNRFLALVPGGRGEELAKAAGTAVQAELGAIGDAVWTWVMANGGKADWKPRWDAQIKAFPQIAWAVQPWLDRDTCLKEVAALPGKEASKRVEAMIDMAETLPDKDGRYFTSATLNNSGVLWSAHYALVDAKLAARRNTRDFTAWDPVCKDAAVKDSLSGKDECIGDEGFWSGLWEKDQDQKIWKKGHRYGAMNLVKRVWCRSDLVKYLRDRIGLDGARFGKALGFDSIPDVADKNTDKSNPYVAVLALDGDEMGRWVSGEKTPEFLKQLSRNAKNYFQGIGKGQGVHRLLTPSYHLQFSEALSNFAIHRAGTLVEKHGGQLVYAGGDDVLALLPASRAIECAEMLRAAFRADRDAWRLYPGSACDVSIGIAVGHKNAPLQMLVREAQKAEKRAKNAYNRAAVAISVYKRSGEILEWGCKWDSKALVLMRTVTGLTEAKQLSGRFPYALAALLKPYMLKGAIPDMLPVIQSEVRHVLGRQGSGLDDGKRKDLAGQIDAYLKVTGGRLEDFINLFLVETFMNRHRGED